MARAITPKPPNYQDRVRKVVENLLSDLALGAQADFEVTTKTWKRKPVFNISSTPGRRFVGTDSLIYKFVQGGTRPHVIRPKRAKALKIGVGFQPKTKIGVIASGPGRTPSRYVLRKAVKHPGTKARGFVSVIALKWARQVKPVWARAWRAEFR